MNDNLEFDQLSALLRSVFALQEREDWLTIMVDLPDERRPDSDAWRDRRSIAQEWFEMLVANAHTLPFSSIRLCTYPHVGSNNNDLPLVGTVRSEPGGAGARELPLAEVLGSSSVVLAFTELSATAPLKLLARTLGFRGATLPGFSRQMLPVLSLDWERVHARVMEFKRRMDRSEAVRIVLRAGGRDYHSTFDLRFRGGHASGGLIRERGIVGNLPSGEAYIVPYEGERVGEPSRTSGELPVQFDEEIVVYRLENNRAVEVHGSGPRADEERHRLEAEPAYGNMAEVGIGVLGEWGVKAVGSILLDEKLGLHIAFGRSDHFGGVTGPAAWSDPDRVVHIDRVYVESTQPAVTVREVTFTCGDGGDETIIRDGGYVA